MDATKDKKKVVKLDGKLNSSNLAFEFDDTLEGWAIVNEIGVGRWLGKVLPVNADRITLQPAFEMSSPSRTPVLAVHPTQGQVEGVIAGFNCGWVLAQPSTHPIENIQASSIQYVSKMSEELRSYLFNIICDTVLGPINPTTGRRGR